MNYGQAQAEAYNIFNQNKDSVLHPTKSRRNSKIIIQATPQPNGSGLTPLLKRKTMKLNNNRLKAQSVAVSPVATPQH
jgi:hypothetical protein